ncbi:hypothetical protein V5O48_010460 [Marasmius crinis-equi]|uniref:Tautomerase cis-CaaD-like domain-containing protein n=1 Tax=Marasmius crinis-equi TaxID=585013 RepID=A0ABR3F8B7_9AGAR
MPFHRFYTPHGLYTPEEKRAIAEAITQIYTRLPKFYVVVNFINIDDGDFFVGGEKNNNFLRILVHHYAYHTEDPAWKRAWMDKYEKAIEPWTKDKGLDWEVQISNADNVFWNQNGMAPPPFESEAFNLWKAENKAIPYSL